MNEEPIVVPYPHPHGRPAGHDYQFCQRCQNFIASGGPEAQRLAILVKQLGRRLKK